MINTFSKNYTKKFIAMSLPINSTLPMAKPFVKLVKRKRDRLTKELGK